MLVGESALAALQGTLEQDIQDVQDALDAHTTAASGAHAATAISVDAIPSITANNVQEALEAIAENVGVIPNEEYLKWRNAADTLDFGVLRLDDQDNTQLLGPAGLSAQSNNNNAGDSGDVTLVSGNAPLNSSGDVLISTGTAGSGSGTVRIKTGDSSAAAAGNIIIQPGSSGAGPNPFVSVIADSVSVSGTVGNEASFSLYSSGGQPTTFTTDPSASAQTYTLPPSDGTAGQVLSTDGSGNLSWEDGGGGVPGVLPNDQALQWEDTGSGLVDVLKLDSADEVILSNSAGGVTINPSFPEASVFIVPGPPDIGNTTNSGSIVAYTESLDDTAPDSMTTGAISATTGDAFGATSGNISMFTGNALSTAETGISGDILIQTGAADDASGEITIRTGSSTNGQSGSVTVELGDSGNGNPAKMLVSNGALEVQGPVGAEALITLAGSSGYTASFESSPDQSDDYVLTLPEDTGSSGQVLSTDGSGLLSWVDQASGGGGDSGINFITNGNADNGLTGWQQYDDGSSVPVDGTGGTVSDMVFLVNSSSQLSGTNCFSYFKNTSSSVMGKGISTDFVIDKTYQARSLTISIDYRLHSGDFDVQSGNNPSELTVWIYDIDNAKLIQPSNYRFKSNSTVVSDRFEAQFQASPTGTNYRLLIHNSLMKATQYIWLFDNVRVYPTEYAYGTPDSDWMPTTITGSWTGAVTYSAVRSRSGDSMKLKGSVLCSGAPTGSNLRFNMPTGITIDLSKVVGTNGERIIGTANVLDAANASYPALVRILNSTTLSVELLGAAGAYANNVPVSTTVPFTFGSGDEVNFSTDDIPIVGWSSSVQLSDSADTRVLTSRYQKSANQTIGPNNSGIKITFDSKVHDTHGAFDTVNSRFVAPCSGFYKLNITALANSTNVTNDIHQIRLYKNGVNIGAIAELVPDAGRRVWMNGAETLELVAGDYVEAFYFSTADYSVNQLTLLSGSGATSFKVERLSGPSAIAASETVAAIYRTSAGQLISNSVLQTVVFGTKVQDTHGAMNAATGVFTAPISGWYHINSVITFSSASSSGFRASDLITSAESVKGIIVAALSGASTRATNSAIVYLQAGQTAQLQALQTSGGSLNLTTDSSENRISIARIGM